LFNISSKNRLAYQSQIEVIEEIIGLFDSFGFLCVVNFHFVFTLIEDSVRRSNAGRHRLAGCSKIYTAIDGLGAGIIPDWNGGARIYLVAIVTIYIQNIDFVVRDLRFRLKVTSTINNGRNISISLRLAGIILRTKL